MTGELGFEDLTLAEKMILEQVSKSTDESISCVSCVDVVTPLLRLTYKSLAPRADYRDESKLKTHVTVNPPAAGKDPDDAYYEAKRVFTDLYGDADFLLREEADNVSEDNE